MSQKNNKKIMTTFYTINSAEKNSKNDSSSSYSIEENENLSVATVSNNDTDSS